MRSFIKATFFIFFLMCAVFSQSSDWLSARVIACNGCELTLQGVLCATVVYNDCSSSNVSQDTYSYLLGKTIKFITVDYYNGKVYIMATYKGKAL